MLVAPFVQHPAEVLGAEVPRLDHGAHGAVENENPALEGLAEKSRSLRHFHTFILAFGTPCPRGSRNPLFVAPSSSARRVARGDSRLEAAADTGECPGMIEVLFPHENSLDR